MSNFTIHQRFSNAGDILRTYNWELIVPPVADITEEDMTIRCRTAIIPGRGNEPIESTFMGMKQFFPGKPVFPHSLAISFEEFEDRKISKAMYAWQQKMFDINENGAATEATKADIVKTLVLQLYSFSGERLPENDRIYLRGAWPQNIDDVTLDYTANESVKYNITFQYDRWDYGA